MQVTRQCFNSVGLSKGKYILKGDTICIENIQKFVDVVWETISTHNRTTVNFVFENVNKK
jgi:hypothetical protein